jgi:hypothetical protein
MTTVAVKMFFSEGELRNFSSMLMGAFILHGWGKMLQKPFEVIYVSEE